MSKGVTIWFTGLSGAGKSTVARIVEKKLKRMGRKVGSKNRNAIKTGGICLNDSSRTLAYFS